MAKENTKTIVFDMDGTIADFYSVSGWLDYLKDEDVFPYKNANPCVDIAGFRSYMECLKAGGYELQIVSWTSKNGSVTYNSEVRKAKIEWLKKYDLLKYFDHIHIVKYGTDKLHTAKRRAKSTDEWYLYDDDAKVRDDWSKKTRQTKNVIAMDENSLEMTCSSFKEFNKMVSDMVASIMSAKP